MLIDINLLPKKEKRNPLFIPIIVGVIAIAILTAFYLNFEKNQLINQKEFTQNSLETARELRIQVESQLANGEATNSVAELERMIEWMETVPVSSVEVMNFVTGLLPSQGFLTSITYGDSGSISINSEFNNLDQVSAYLYHLQQSSWVRSAQLHSVSAVEGEEEVTGYTANFTIQLDVARMKADRRANQ